MEKAILISLISMMLGGLLGSALVSDSYRQEMKRMDYNKTIGEYRKEKGF